MKAPQIILCSLVLLSLLVSSCGDSQLPGSQNSQVSESIPDSNIEIVKVARVVLDSDIEWKDSITDDGRLVRLFQAPAPNPDETRHYRVKEGERIFAIVLARFGSTWQGTVVDFSGDDPMRQFERANPEECLAAIQSEFQFAGEIEHVAGCAFP